MDVVDPGMGIIKHGDNDPKTCPHKWHDWGMTTLDSPPLKHQMCWGCHLHQFLDEQGNVVREEQRH